jgi:hypothetical protein
MTDDEILNDGQRRDLAAYGSVSNPDAADDSELLSSAAERMGMTGELAVDPDGIIELMRDDILVVLESVSDEDRDLVDHPELLHLAILLRPRSEEGRAELERANLLDPREPAQSDSDGMASEWAYAWWGSMATKLARDTPLSTQMETLNRVMNEAELVVEQGELTGFFDRIAWLQHEDEMDDDDDFDDDDLDDDDWQPEDEA